MKRYRNLEKSMVNSRTLCPYLSAAKLTSPTFFGAFIMVSSTRYCYQILPLPLVPRSLSPPWIWCITSFAEHWYRSGNEYDVIFLSFTLLQRRIYFPAASHTKILKNEPSSAMVSEVLSSVCWFSSSLGLHRNCEFSMSWMSEALY